MERSARRAPTESAADRSPRRALLAAIVALAALAGVVELHVDEPLRLHPWDGELVAGAVHPEQPAHVEKAGEPHPFCPACLLHVSARGAHPAPAAAPVVLASAGEAAPLPASALLEPSHSPLSSRGPPRG